MLIRASQRRLERKPDGLGKIPLKEEEESISKENKSFDLGKKARNTSGRLAEVAEKYQSLNWLMEKIDAVRKSSE